MNRFDDCGIIENGKVISFRESRGFKGNIVIPEGVTEIGNSCYEVAYCSIKKVVIPSTVKRIGNRAFACCEELQEIIIPEGVEIIDKEAFHHCHSLAKISIPSTVTSIGTGAFDDCGNIEEITVANNNPVYRSEGNCLIETKKKTLLRGCRNSVIPAGGSVTVIGEKAFSNNCAHPRNNVHSKGNTQIIIPDGITKICKRAFDFNYGLETVILSDSVKTIEKEAFSRCQSLKSIKFGSGIQTIGDNAFYYAKALKTDLILPDSLIKIGASAFYESGIESVALGKNVKIIEKNAFGCCKNLKQITFSGAVEIGEWAFSNCYALKSLAFANTLKTIGKNAFYNCTALKSITFNNELETIGEGAFECCLALESVEIPESVKYIGTNAFAYCEKLSSVKLPASVEFMGNGVFKESPVKVAAPKKVGAAGFEIADNVLIKYKGKSADVIIPDGVTKIAAKAFYNKKYVESITLPASLTSIANRAIERCANLKTITVNSANAAYRNAGNCLVDVKKKTVIYGFENSVIPSDGSVTAIAAYAFSDTNIQNLTVPDGVKTIGSCAFKYCIKLKSIDLPKTLKSIGPSAFKYCESLESITIPQSLTAIGAEAFSECTALTEINFNADSCNDLSSIGAFESAGKKAEGITVNVGANVQRIPISLFQTSDKENTAKIKQVIFAENSVCKFIGEDAFSACAEIKSIILPDSITEISRDAFNGCTALTDINIPKSTTVIGAYAFCDCINIKELVIPKGVTKLSYAFEGCGGLERIEVEEGNERYHSSGNCLIETQTKILIRGCCNSVIPSDGSVVRLDNYSFNKCKKLESIVIPDGVTEIFNNAFENCTKLKSVTLAKTVTYVCNPYFEGCTSLESITAARELLEKYKYFGFKGKEFGLKNRRVEFSFL